MFPMRQQLSPLPNELTTPPVTKMYFIEERSPFRASKLLLQRFCVGRRIYPGRSLGGDEHMNLYTIF